VKVGEEDDDSPPSGTLKDVECRMVDDEKFDAVNVYPAVRVCYSN
jgi:hypothetical protein